MLHDLIQQRLEQMVILPVHQRDGKNRILQSPHAFQPAKSATQHHHPNELLVID
jgi:hypothetical protein